MQLSWCYGLLRQSLCKITADVTVIQWGSKLWDHFENRDSKLNLNLENKQKVILKLMIICNAYHIICHEKKNLSLIRKLQKHFSSGLFVIISKGFLMFRCQQITLVKTGSRTAAERSLCVYVCVCEYLIQIDCCRSDQCANACH